jgi:phosphoglycerate dehydrogenase-like enzyme
VIEIGISARGFRQTPGAHHAFLDASDIRARFPNNDRPLRARELAEFATGCAGLIVGTDEVTDAVLAAGPLRAVVRFGSGMDNIDLDAASRRGVRVDSTPGANARSVAELSVALMLALARNLTIHDRAVRGGKWSRTVGIELEGKTLGIVGYGAVGREMARVARGLGMEILVCDPYVEATAATASLHEVLSGSDVVSFHLTLNEETVGLIGRRELNVMKEGALLINTARGGIVDEEAVATALEEGRLGGAAFDSFVSEPPQGSPLLQIDSFIGSPHAGASTFEAVERTGIRALERLLELLRETQ